MKVKILLIALVAILTTGCQWQRDAAIASKNLSKQADMFQIKRRIVFYNGITDKYILSITGFCSIHDDGHQLEVTCKTGQNSYKKHFLGLSDNVTYFAEQIDSADTNIYQYEVVFKPSAILPKIEVK